MNRGIALMLALMLLAGGAGAAEKVRSLRGGNPMGEETPGQTATFEGAQPGTNKLFPRGYDGAPPQVPHDNTGLSITPEMNDCLLCHDPNNQQENTPYVPATHLADGMVDSARFVCTLCHVQQTDARPLVKNGNDRFIVKKMPQAKK